MTTKVFFSCANDDLKDLNNLTPGQSGKWKDLERVGNINDADYLVILEDTSEDISESFKNNRKVVAFPLTMDMCKQYMKFHFKHRYGWGSKGGRVVCSLPEGYTYDRLMTLKCPEKTKAMSCVLYEKTPRYPIEWLKKLAKRRAFDVFGYDHKIGGLSTYMGLGDRVKEYEPYQMTLVFEDDSRENYFTERLTDPILLWCKPYYWGCTNLKEIFNYLDFFDLGINNNLQRAEIFDSVVQEMTIDNQLTSTFSLDTQARRQILDKLNVWERVFNIKVEESDKSIPSIQTKPEKVFPDMNVAKDGICLIMIVRDEAHVIERCFDSVVNVIDSYLICDTGSVDDTPEIIERYMDSHGIPGQVIYKKWKNFGYNKSYVIRRAYEENLSLGAKYLIWLDADEVFRNTEGKNLTIENRNQLLEFANSHPDHSIFMVMTHYAGLEYQRWNMVRNNQLYKWNCPVHEWLSGTKSSSSVFLDFVTVLARKEGARTRAGDSGRKDVLMFEEHLREKPTCSRCVFYLAQTLGESGELEKSIEMYAKRLTMPGFYQECYIATMRMGHFYMKLNKPEKAFEIWEKGWNFIKTRLEIPYYYMMALMGKKRRQDAYDVATRAYNEFKFNINDLFVQKQIYDWRFFLEYSVVAHYTGHDQRAFELGQRLINEGKYPDAQATVIEQNMGIFRRKIAPKNTPTHLSRKFNLHPPMVVVMDDFLPNPDEVREFALAQEFTIKGNYPGQRTKPFCTSEHKEIFERILGSKITYWPTGDNSYNGAFQYTFGRHVSWIHRDLTDYSALLYLTPDAPVDGGTLTYRHKELKIERDSEAKSKDEIKQLNDDSSNEDKWEKMDIIANKYNRLVIFSGRRSHKSNKYFGSSKQNGRLFQTFFFNVEDYH